VPVQDFLSQRAVNVIVGGSYTLPNWYDPQGKLRTFACRTTRVSPFRMIVEVRQAKVRSLPCGSYQFGSM